MRTHVSAARREDIVGCLPWQWQDRYARLWPDAAAHRGRRAHASPEGVPEEDRRRGRGECVRRGRAPSPAWGEQHLPIDVGHGLLSVARSAPAYPNGCLT